MWQARTRRIFTLMLVLLLATGAVASAAGGNPGVVPPDARVQGLNYAQWTILWWQYLFSIPASTNPLAASGPEDPRATRCAVQRVGNVALVVSYFAANQPITCQVPPDMTLVVELLSSECSNLDPPPMNAKTPAEMLACARQFRPQNQQAAIDGVALQNLDQYILATPPYLFWVPQDNVFGHQTGPAGTIGMSVAYGELLMLRPLSAGDHTIRLHAEMPWLPFTADRTLLVKVK